jgi:hypothetical protein
MLVQLWNGISRLRHWAAGSFIFCEMAAFRKLDGFSKELFASEEIEFSKRLNILARERRKKIVILHEHPLVTSARKIHLYTLREHVWFLTKTKLQHPSARKAPRLTLQCCDGRSHPTGGGRILRFGVW